MKFFMQFGIICAVSLAGTVLNKVIPLPMPPAVWGMILMFILLITKIVKLNQVEEAADFLLSIMTVLFIPVSVGIMESFHMFKNEMFSIALVSIVSLVVCFAVTGSVAQIIMQIKNKHTKE